MAEEDVIGMRLRDLRRLKAVQEAIEGHITQRAAASKIGYSERQVRRLVRRVREEGERGIIHKGRGRPSNQRIPSKVKEKAVARYRRRYLGFGPTLASEKLNELEGITVSRETLRQWLIDAGLWKKRRKKSAHREWRERRECFGELVQMDGSHHDWLEGRGPELVLMGYKDDATGEVIGGFYGYEGTMPAMESFKRYIREYGLPQGVYLDRHTTYKSPRKLTPEEELKGLAEPQSQFERALEELGVEVIHALSPQAKGRIERQFGVFQDRLVKEMRLAGVKTKEEANEFLEGYLPKYNEKFRKCPANKTDAHTKLPKDFDLDRYLCIKKERTIRNDNTVAYEGKLYQVEERSSTKKVTVEERLDGSVHIMNGDKRLKYRVITERPKKEAAAMPEKKAYHRPGAPPKDHPWRKWQNRKRNWTYAY